MRIKNLALVFAGFTFSAAVAAQPMKIVDLHPQVNIPIPWELPLVASYASGRSDDNLVVGWTNFINDPPTAFQTQRPFVTCEGCTAVFFDIFPFGFNPDGFATAISDSSEYAVGSTSLWRFLQLLLLKQNSISPFVCMNCKSMWLIASVPTPRGA
jgi:hypothetical protein